MFGETTWILERSRGIHHIPHEIDTGKELDAIDYFFPNRFARILDYEREFSGSFLGKELFKWIGSENETIETW
ncbi:MAG: hypothetical protein ACD_78C00100G0007 [uncultured bacterium (gcode 4)]|uniref:Uncharacterized protein n=1 Tax=uncultured bacterium (gcode 4) TaxID=1234023 RepID=K1YY11_9BACT|nr:MAG: hypothetical protein ACD_78C00100G0007 [uncultured bacterium (gcode 4)]